MQHKDTSSNDAEYIKKIILNIQRSFLSAHKILALYSEIMQEILLLDITLEQKFDKDNKAAS